MKFGLSKQREHKMEHIIYTQIQFDHDIKFLTKQLSESKFVPDLIVGLMRGGVIPAIHLSHKLDCPVSAIEWSTRDAKVTDKKQLDKIAIMAEHGKKVLVIDDIVDSGKTMREIKERMFDTKDNVKYASLWFNPSQSVTVDFYCNIIDRAVDERWIIFPWEKQ